VILIDQKSDQYFSGRTSSNHRISFTTHSQLSLGSKVSVIVKDIQQGKLIGDLIDASH
jgi:tRNA A37 methylthiotransferase MiaB